MPLHPVLRAAEEARKTRPAVGHMPFSGHRTQEEVREDEDLYARWLRDGDHHA